MCKELDSNQIMVTAPTLRDTGYLTYLMLNRSPQIWLETDWKINTDLIDNIAMVIVEASKCKQNTTKWFKQIMLMPFICLQKEDIKRVETTINIQVLLKKFKSLSSMW